MDPINDQVSHYLQSLSEDSFHALQELGADACGDLSKHFRATGESVSSEDMDAYVNALLVGDEPTLPKNRKPVV